MKNKFAWALAGLLAISTAAFAADGRDHRYGGGDYRGGSHQEYRGGGDYRGGDYRGGSHQEYRGGWGGDYYRRGGGGVYLGVAPSYGYSYNYVAPAPYVDPYAYTAPAPYVDQYAAPYADPYAAPYTDEYVGPPPFAGAIWVGGYWGSGPHGRYWIRGHWGRRR
jgi:hypothetical protein